MNFRSRTQRVCSWQTRDTYVPVSFLAKNGGVSLSLVLSPERFNGSEGTPTDSLEKTYSQYLPYASPESWDVGSSWGGPLGVSSSDPEDVGTEETQF